MEKDTFYFSHDYNARTDDKIKRLLVKHSMLGYGIYWAIVENLYNNTNVLRLDYDSISYELHTKKEVVKSVINDFDLFNINTDTFSSNSVQRRLDKRNSKSLKAKESINKRWGNTNVLRPNYDSNTINESKVKESKVKEKKVFIAPTATEVQDYFIENGYMQESGLKAWNYYTSANWTDGQGKQVKNWKQKMQGVWFKDENKIISTPTARVLERKHFENENQYLNYCKENNLTPKAA